MSNKSPGTYKTALAFCIAVAVKLLVSLVDKLLIDNNLLAMLVYNQINKAKNMYIWALWIY